MKFNKIVFATLLMVTMIGCTLFNTTKVHADLEEKIYIYEESSYRTYGDEATTPLTRDLYSIGSNVIRCDGNFEVVWTDEQGTPITDESKKPQGVTYEITNNTPSAEYFLPKPSSYVQNKIEFTIPKYLEVGDYYYYITYNDTYRSGLSKITIKQGSTEYLNSNYTSGIDFSFNHQEEKEIVVICKAQYEKFTGKVIIYHPFEKDTIFATITPTYEKDDQTGGVKVTFKTSDFATLDASNFRDPEYPDEGPFGYSVKLIYDENYYKNNYSLDLYLTGEKPVAKKTSSNLWIFAIVGVAIVGFGVGGFILKKKNPELFAKLFKKAGVSVLNAVKDEEDN